MARDMPEPTFIEFGQVAKEPVPVAEDLSWQRVVEFLRSRELSANTLKVYERQLQLFYAWTQKKPWHDITHRDIDRYKQHLKNQPSKRGGTLAPTTINQALATLKSFFKWLTVKDYITRNPTLTIEFLKGLWPRLVRNWAIRLKAIPSLGYKPQNQAGSEKVLTNRQSVS